jgi:hypothetical protein
MHKFLKLFILVMPILVCDLLSAYSGLGKKKYNDENTYELLVTGCGRSGTTYISQLLTLSGLDIPHELMGEHGVASWYMAVDSKEAPHGPGAKGFHFKRVYHQVRHPLDVISSWRINIPSADKKVWAFICSHISEISLSEPILVKCAKYWYYWNLEAEKKAHWRYRIEDIDAIFPFLCRNLGIEYSSEVLNMVPKDSNRWANYPDRVTWAELKAALDPKDYRNITRMAKNYGYEVE